MNEPVLPLLLLLMLTAAPAARAMWHECNSQGMFGGMYGLEVLANLTEFRSGLLSHVWSSFDPDVPYPAGFKRFDPMHTFIQCPPGQQLATYGKGDGAKQLCDLSKLTAPPCVIYSLGSNGDYSFERDILAATKCSVHTFDCTFNGKSIDPERHTYHKTCVGSKPADPSFKTWAEITRSLGHQVIDVAKIDIEGHETSVLSEFRHNTVLPRQLVTEIHIKGRGVNLPDVAARTPAQVALMFLHLANLGYGVINRADNLFGAPGCCAEFAFLHVERRWHQGSVGSGRGAGRRGARGGSSSRLRVERAGAANSLAVGAGAAAANLAAAAAAAQAAADKVAAASGPAAGEATQQLLLEAAASAATAAAAAASAVAAADGGSVAADDTAASSSSTAGGGGTLAAGLAPAAAQQPAAG